MPLRMFNRKKEESQHPEKLTFTVSGKSRKSSKVKEEIKIMRQLLVVQLNSKNNHHRTFTKFKLVWIKYWMINYRLTIRHGNLWATIDQFWRHFLKDAFELSYVVVRRTTQPNRKSLNARYL